MKLRDYQVQCLQAIKDRYLAGIRRQLICLPTGTGKTVIFAQFPSFFQMKKRMLVLAHREELLEQARQKLLDANAHLQVHIEQGSRHAEDTCDVVIASIQTLGRKGSKRLLDLPSDEFYLVVVDEAHHATAATYRRVLDHFGLFEQDSKKLLVGFTATPKRGDGQGLDTIFEEIAFSRTLPEMIDAGHLCPLRAYRIETEIDLSKVKSRMGDFVAAQLSDAVNVAERNDVVIDCFRKHLSGRQALCFCVDVAHARDLAHTFCRADIACAAVTGDMPSEERRRVLEAFRQAKLQVLTNCLVLTEGYDEPSIEGILLARPTKSVVLYAQMIGRGTRLHPGKENVTIVDIVDVTRDQKLIQLASLFGLPSQFDLQGKTTQEAHRAIQWVHDRRPWVRTDLATSLDDLRYRCREINLFDLETPAELDRACDYAWSQTGPRVYRLNLADGEHLTVSPTIMDSWEVTFQRADVEETGEETCEERQTLEEAIHHAEKLVQTHRADAVGLVHRRSRWRQQPASEKQLQILTSKGLNIPENLTKGQASHLISMIFHGNR